EELRRYVSEALGLGGAGAGRPQMPSGGGLGLQRPSIAGDAPQGAPGQDPALMLGDPSKLRLRDPNQDLQLDLDR
ncbi:MAG: hypothetical protein WBG86_03400, partial [Polyangiales bacterium]